MTIKEMYALINDVVNNNQDLRRMGNSLVLGLRFENKDCEIGEICGYSKSNIDREDEREFPEFGTEEYDELEILDGTSAWGLECESILNHKGMKDDESTKRYYDAKHCYIVAGYFNGTGEDQNEILIDEAEVIAKIF